MRIVAAVAIVIVGCAEPVTPDVVGPFTGEARRFVVDGYRLPVNGATVRELGDDLNGDGVPDNQAGIVIAFLAANNNHNLHIADMIAAGKLASFVELQADDALDDNSVGVSWTASPDAAPVIVGGRLVDGVFQSNRTRTTRAPVTATVHVPAVLDADPVIVDVHGFEVDLVPDGAGGFDAFLHGGIRHGEVEAVLVPAVLQMVAANPANHVPLMDAFDTSPRDGVLTAQEVARNNLIVSLTSADMTLFGEESLSFGIAVHLTACPSGNCAAGVVNAPCFDRVRDGDEADVDCGGSCSLACAAGQSCTARADCQTETCAFDNRCTAPTCSDGVADGFESDVDCGGISCARCANGKRCLRNADCDSTTSFCGGAGVCRPF